MRCSLQPFARAESSLNLRGGDYVMSVPATDGSDDAARVDRSPPGASFTGRAIVEQSLAGLLHGFRHELGHLLARHGHE